MRGKKVRRCLDHALRGVPGTSKAAYFHTANTDMTSQLQQTHTHAKGAAETSYTSGKVYAACAQERRTHKRQE